MVARSDGESNLVVGQGTRADANEPLPASETGETSWPIQDEHGYKIREQPMGTKRRVKVIIQGAGASALNFFKKAEEEMRELDIVCYEKNPDVGGTWYENRYPGCACDIPSVNYQFTWKIKLWTHYYSYSSEIFEYLKDIEREGNFIEKYIKLRHEITRVEWDDDAGLWRVKARNIETGEEVEDAAEFFINAGGVLNNWKWPDVPGLKDFKGKLMHTAKYDRGFDLTGKRVAVLGAGSSGVQCVANIQPKVEHLYHWVRSPIWISAAFAQRFGGTNGANFAYSEEQRRFLSENPQKYLEYRKQIENELNQRFKFILKGSDAAKEARAYSEDQMKQKLGGDARLVDKIIPKNFNVGCRRPTPAPGYLEALVAPNATIFTDAIASITETGFIDHEGKAYEVDVFICATGFDTSWQPRYPFIAHGTDLRDLWSDESGGVTSYLSVGVPGFPNHFSFCGPYGPLGHGSFMPLIESWTRYIFAAITKVQTEDIKSVTPKVEAAKQFRQHADLFLQRTAWTMACRSWFKQGKIDGQAAIWPGSRVQFLEVMKAPRWEDYDVQWWGNRFSWLGDGFHVREFDGRDITDYLGNLDKEGRDIQPEWDESLIDTLAGWAIGA